MKSPLRIMVPPLLDQEPKARRSRGQKLALLGLALVIVAIVVLLIFR